MTITANQVSELRARTGAGMMDCKRALSETNGDIDAAIEHLRKTGIAKAEKKSDREASEGLVHSYIHPGGRVGVLIQVSCETDFVAKTDDFLNLVKDLAMQVAAASPRSVRREEIPESIVAKEREVFLAQMADQKKPAAVMEKILQGKVDKFFAETVLLEQPFIKDDSKTVDIVVKEISGKLGENIVVRRFARFALGEGA
ncbi:MAG: translation elongation factor Ts [Candidatus Eisenbacteria bacterium]|nr:translation elongation factor Ts [Candidatus Eisenbacteria bacterium]